MGRWLSKIQKPTVSNLTQLTEIGELIESDCKGEVSLLHPRKLPPELLEPPRENKTTIDEHVVKTVSSHVWCVQVDGHQIRVVDPARQARAEFEFSMVQQFGSARVGSCRRLWPGETRDD